MRTSIIPNRQIIIRKRVLSGLNKVDVAKAAGIPHSSVIRAENGQSVSPKTATGICKALGVNFDDLFTIQDTVEESSTTEYGPEAE